MSKPIPLHTIGLLFILVGVFDISHNYVVKLVTGKSLYSSRAYYKVPTTGFTVVLERRAIHLFLAEYERTLRIYSGSREIVTRRLSDDSGGYSKVNVYGTPAKELVFRDLWETYVLDSSGTMLRRSALDEQVEPKKFLGAFDRDEKGWRFVPAIERSETRMRSRDYAYEK